jgi:hypothetical protein
VKLLCAFGLHKWLAPPLEIFNHEGEFSHTEWTCACCGYVEEQWLDRVTGTLQRASKRKRVA